MHGSLDKPPQDGQGFSIRSVALPVLAIIAVMGMLVSHPRAARWISEAVQAEFVGSELAGTDLTPDIASPAQVARPRNEIRTVRAY